jgi:hypothetical protein
MAWNTHFFGKGIIAKFPGNVLVGVLRIIPACIDYCLCHYGNENNWNKHESTEDSLNLFMQ